MKKRVIAIGAWGVKELMILIYGVIKLFTRPKVKVVFCSRQKNSVPLDFHLLQQMLELKYGNVEIATVCCRLEKSVSGFLRFGSMTFLSMYHLATSRVCVIDSYWPAVSILNHREDLTVIQIWHAIGKLKKSGRASLGKRDGRSVKSAELLKMHANYDIVIAGGKFWNPYYCESFGISERSIRNYGLPRIDYLLKNETASREAFFREYSEAKGRRTVLYTPTFRRSVSTKWEELIRAFEGQDVNLIIKTHPNEKISPDISLDHLYFCPDWETIDLLGAADVVITDYSSMSLEAAVLEKTTYFWVYDYDDYIQHNGMNIDLYKEAPGMCYRDVHELVRAIMADENGNEVAVDWHKRLLPEDLGRSTEQIVGVIVTCLERRPFSKMTRDANVPYARV